MGHEGFAERQTFVDRSTMSQGLLGIAAIILGIVGLAIMHAHPNVPVYLAAIAVIILGISLMVAGTGFAVAYGRLAARMESAGGQMSGMSAGMLLGSSVVVLGILGILSVASEILVPIAVIVIGSGLILSSGASVRMATLEGDLATERTAARRVNEETVFATAAFRAIAGIAVVILGILGLSGGVALVLTLAAVIVAGAALNGPSVDSRVATFLVPRRA
jgi:hypothetical protein